MKISKKKLALQLPKQDVYFFTLCLVSLSLFLVVIISVILPGVDMCCDFHRSESVK